MTSILNIAAYLFVALDHLAPRRERLLENADNLGLKGTVLLAEEGINLFLAGEPASVYQWLDQLRADPPFAALTWKESWSDTVPFKRLKVRIKNEIIRMNHPTIAPQSARAPAVSATTLKRWLDQGADDSGRPILMLDTRNDFEVEAGRFAHALDLGIRMFTEFPQEVKKIREQFVGKTVVSYCTGGIRCEKASLYLTQLGLSDHWQLDGGILKYFEEVGGAHYEGRCVVFDEREALHPDLSP